MAKISSYSLSTIHAAILAKRGLTTSAATLKVHPHTLSSHLDTFSFRDDSPVSFEKLVSMTPEQARTKFGDSYV